MTGMVGILGTTGINYIASYAHHIAQNNIKSPEFSYLKHVLDKTDIKYYQDVVKHNSRSYSFRVLVPEIMSKDLQILIDSGLEKMEPDIGGFNFTIKRPLKSVEYVKGIVGENICNV